MSQTTYDVLVLGAGMAGLTIARKAAKAGKRVAIVDTRPYGGTCALRGCDPKKVLVGAAEVIDRTRRLRPHGIQGAVHIDWPDLMAFKRSFTEPVPKALEHSLAESGVATLHGRPRFTGPATLQLGEDILQAERIAIAVGARPRTLTFPGAEHAISSAEFLDLEALPGRILFIGGGYVSFEFAHVAARAGASATILHRHPRALPHFDPDLVDKLIEETRGAGVDVELGQEVTGIEGGGASFSVLTADARRYEADLVVHGAGRVPELDGLELEAAGIRYDPARGIEVDDHLRSTTNPRAYAAGDAADTPGWPLTPVAVHEAHTVAANLVRGDSSVPEYAGTPSVVFTTPNLARAGLLEREARAQGRAVTVRHQDTHGWYSARRVAQPAAAHKIIEDAETGEILGAHLLGDRAGDVIDMFALAIRHGLTAKDLKTSILVHPADASDVASMV